MSAAIFQDAVWVIDILIGLLLTLGGVLMNNLWTEVKELRKAKHAHTSEIAALKILVVGDYVKRDELRDIMKDITSEMKLGFTSLNTRIDSGFSELYDELKHKVDKP